MFASGQEADHRQAVKNYTFHGFTPWCAAGKRHAIRGREGENLSSANSKRDSSRLIKSRRYCPAHTIEIRASIEAIWTPINHFDAWGSWNPLYVESSGSFAVGGILHFTVALPGMKPQTGTATVVTVRPRELLEYQMLSLGGLLRAIRFIEIQRSGPDQYKLTNGEIMGGLLAPVFFRIFGKRIQLGLKGMNEALKELAEAR